MPDAHRPLLADLKGDLAGAAAEMREMAALRIELARQEAVEAIAAVKRLAIVGAAAGVAILSALPVLIVSAAHGLARWPGGLPEWGWMLALAAGFITGGALAGWLGWRRFRREFTGFRETLEEFREDLVWLREWAGKGKADGL